MTIPKKYAAHPETVLQLIDHPLGNSPGLTEVEQ